MVVSAQETSRVLLSLNPYVAEILAVEALLKAIMGPIGFDLNKDNKQTGKGEDLLWLMAACQNH
jgi:hypothetical protein